MSGTERAVRRHLSGRLSRFGCQKVIRPARAILGDEDLPPYDWITSQLEDGPLRVRPCGIGVAAQCNTSC